MTDLRERLERLGLRKGVAGLKPPAERKVTPAIEDLVGGEIVHTEHGPCLVVETTYPLEHVHGHLPLQSLLEHDPQTAAYLACDPAVARLDFRQAAFLDTETTGLAGGTGTYTFLVGVGFFTADSFVIRQYFMRDVTEEQAQLSLVGQLLDRLNGVVSFNGRAFDVPLLEARFLLSRLPPRLTGAPHFDLLPAARRLWRERLDSCALNSLEQAVLGVQRSSEDVPGWLIPSLYFQYLRTRDPRPLGRVFYHNRMDILSLVVLAAQMCQLFVAPLGEGSSPPPPEDLYSLGKLYESLDLKAEAERVYRAALENHPPSHIRRATLRRLGLLLKRQNRREEAVPVWEELVTAGDALYAYVELAKYYEWHAHDCPRAAEVTRRAITTLKAEMETTVEFPTWKARQVLGELEHRLRRLERKMAHTRLLQTGPHSNGCLLRGR